MKPKILFVVNHGAFFASHRLPIAVAAQRRGFEVALITGAAGSDAMEALADQRIATTRIPHHRARFSASGLNPFKELRGLIDILRLMRRFRPDVVHCVSPKGVLLGGLAALLSHQRGLIFAISGMGFVMTRSSSRNLMRATAARCYLYLLRWLFKAARTIIVQNRDDRRLLLTRLQVRDDQVVLIPGSGVDLSALDCTLEAKKPIVLFAGRMLMDKGVREFVEAARLLQARAVGWRFVMAGAADYQNPTAVSGVELGAWKSEGVVELAGHVEDSDSLFKEASIVCLPSYREGMPKVLLEAAAARCAVVTTDAVGCREAILPEESGLLVPLYDPVALADALHRLICDRGLRERFGARGRSLAVEQFGLSAVVEQHLAIYDAITRKAREDMR